MGEAVITASPPLPFGSQEARPNRMFRRMAGPFYTIGHSTRPLPEFLQLLSEAGVQILTDVRTVPRSRTNPQYNRDTFPAVLAAAHVDYEHMPALGGRRSRQRDVPHEMNAFWDNRSFHNYADYAMGQPFHLGLAQLRGLADQRRCAIMCSEAVWWRCHRRIIADYLLAAGEPVFHILGPGKIEPARMTEAAQAGSPGSLRYPPSQGLLV
jgi:uncharacterized protein (DUF488 family)